MTDVDYRNVKYKRLGLQPHWQDAARAQNAYEYGFKYVSPSGYGLDNKTTANVQRHVVKSLSVASAWVREHWNAEGSVQIVDSATEVCVLESREFLDEWENLFTPGRDDVLILHNLDQRVMFYSRKDIVEIGDRRCDGRPIRPDNPWRGLWEGWPR